MNKIKSNHPFTLKQLKSLNTELKKISNIEITSLKGVTIPGKDNYTDLQILKSPYTLDIFLSFIDISIPSSPKSQIFSISTLGKVDYKTRSNMKFDNFSDRIHFFNTLINVDLSE